MRKLMNNILGVLDKKEKKQFYLLLILDLFISLADILTLALLLWIVHFYLEPAGNPVPNLLPGWMTDRHSVWLIAGFALLFGLKNGWAFRVARKHHRFVSHVAVRVSREQLESYQRSDYGAFVQTDSAVHIRNICFRPFEYAQYMLTGVQQLITQLTLITLSITAILLFNARLFLLLLVILLPPVIGVFYFIKKRLARAKEEIQSGNERSFQYLLDALKGYVEGNIYDRNDFFLRRFSDAREKFSTSLFESLSLQNLPGRLIEVFAITGLFILIGIAQWKGINENDTVITLGAFMAAAYKIIPGLVKIINTGGQMKAYISSVGASRKETDEQAPQKEGPPQPERIGSIEFQSVSFQYDRQPVLQRFSMTVNPGDFIGISGISGKGKTTLLNLLLGFLPPSAGSIRVNGIARSNKELQAFWPSIAYVRQQGFFIHDTLLRNITLEEKDYDPERLNAALAVSGLDKMLSVFPEGTGFMITENGKNLSGGQQQRVAIARALYKKASLVLLDEPFNELDEDAVNELLAHFKKLSAAGTTVIMITHDKHCLGACNKIISLDE